MSVYMIYYASLLLLLSFCFFFFNLFSVQFYLEFYLISRGVLGLMTFIVDAVLVLVWLLKLKSGILFRESYCKLVFSGDFIFKFVPLVF